MVFPLLALVIEERGGTSFHTAAAFIAFKLACFFTTPLYSIFLDLYGLHKWIIMPCVLGTTFAYLILALAQDPYLSIAGMLFAPFIAGLGLWLSSVAFAVSNVKVAAPNLSDEPSSDTSEGTPLQDDPTLESFSIDTRNEDACENDVSREEMQSQESCLRVEKELSTQYLSPIFEPENTDEEESLDAMKEERVSDNIADSQPVAQSSNEPQFGSYVIVATFLAGAIFSTVQAATSQFLMIYARDKFDVDDVKVSSVLTVGELNAFLLAILMQQKPNLVAPGGLFACVGLVPSLLLQYYSKEEQSASFEGFGLFAVGVVLTLIAFSMIRRQFDPILLRHVKRDQAALTFGKHKCALMLGDVFGMLLGSVVWDWNWKCIMLVPAIPLNLCVFSILFWIYHYSRASLSEDTCDVVPDHKTGQSVDVVVTVGSDAKLCRKPDSAHRPQRRSSLLTPLYDITFDDIMRELEEHSMEAAKSKFVKMRDQISKLQSLLRAVMPSTGQPFNYERIPQGSSQEEARASVHDVEGPSATRLRGVRSRRRTRMVFTDLQCRAVEQRHSKSVRQSFLQELGASSFS
ncbi:hypothetical protein CYMTET_11390 [Cymbomonas tetramitiformis]|uniref:Uncharacterized protein n=1 Tax=Cymbomonas tetramitiformis TaxID=36881 RepID=A0AAE0LDI4_9CHLO|nr:hypothetical protein CYMTET_11390 [Cymbomonas tetramitiformis]